MGPWLQAVFGRGVQIPPCCPPYSGDKGLWVRPLLADGDREGFSEVKARRWAPEEERDFSRKWWEFGGDGE